MSKIFTPATALSLALTIALPFAMAADDCSYIRLDAPGKPMHQVRVRDQDREGTCYAQAAAGLIDATRFSSGDTQTDLEASADHLAFATKASSRRTGKLNLTSTANLFSGDVLETLKKAQARGSCLLPKALLEKNPLFARSLISRYSSITGLIEFRAAHQEEDKRRPPDWSRGILSAEDIFGLRVENDHLGLESSEMVKELKSGAIPRLPDMIQWVKETNANEATLKSFEHSCVGVVSKSDLQKYRIVHREYHQYQSRFIVKSDLDDLLELPQALPVIISFDARSVREGKLFGTKESKFLYHAALVIGRRRSKTGSCEYLLRNSSGKNCKEISNTWECHEHQGDAWIDALTLASSILKMDTWVKRELK